MRFTTKKETLTKEDIGLKAICLEDIEIDIAKAGEIFTLVQFNENWNMPGKHFTIESEGKDASKTVISQSYLDKFIFETPEKKPLVNLTPELCDYVVVKGFVDGKYNNKEGTVLRYRLYSKHWKSDDADFYDCYTSLEIKLLLDAGLIKKL